MHPTLAREEMRNYFSTAVRPSNDIVLVTLPLCKLFCKGGKGPTTELGARLDLGTETGPNRNQSPPQHLNSVVLCTAEKSNRREIQIFGAYEVQ